MTDFEIKTITGLLQYNYIGILILKSGSEWNIADTQLSLLSRWH